MFFTWILPCVSHPASSSSRRRLHPTPDPRHGLVPAPASAGPGLTAQVRALLPFPQLPLPSAPSRALVYIDERGMLFSEEASFSLCVGPAFSWLGWGSRSPLVQPGLIRAVKPQEGAGCCTLSGGGFSPNHHHLPQPPYFKPCFPCLSSGQLSAHGPAESPPSHAGRDAVGSSGLSSRIHLSCRLR